MTPPTSDPSTGLNAAVAAELRAAQGRSKLTVKSLARVSGIPYGTLRRYMDGERHINVSILEEIADALETTAQDLVTAAAAQLAKQQSGKPELTVHEGGAGEASPDPLSEPAPSLRVAKQSREDAGASEFED